MADEWWQPLRALNDRYFVGPEEGVRWDRHIEQLNKQLGLSGRQRLFTFPKADLPPAWFIGDATSVEPGDWVLVFSLNPATDNDSEFYSSKNWDAGSFWEYQTSWLKCWFNSAFHGPLAKLASGCLGKSFEDTERIRNFAAKHMVFVELCPYASSSFALSAIALKQLREEDVGCRVEAEITDRMLHDGAPRLVLVNGNSAVEYFGTTYNDALSWNLRQYRSEAKPEKNLWHMEGALQIGGRSIPVIGFPFLRKPRTHNATSEIEQLARFARERVGAGS